MMEARPVSASQVVMTEMVLPQHTNALETVFGGVVMSWIDIAGAISAQRHCQRPVVTASLDDLHFVAPVRKGWIVNLKASVNFVSNTSMEVGVRVEGENPIENTKHHVATAYLTFVALDGIGRPTKVPGVIPETEDEKKRCHAAQERRKMRMEKRQRLEKYKTS